MSRTLRHLGPVAIAVVAMLAIAGPAHATLIGTTVDIHTVFTDLSAVTVTGDDSPTVDASVEIGPCVAFSGVCINPSLSTIDIGASTIAIAYTEFFGSENSFLFTNIEEFGMPGTVIQLVSASLQSGGNAPTPGFTKDSVSIDLAPLSGPGSGDILLLTLRFGQAGGGNAPEPSTLLLLGVGLVGLYTRRRKA